MALSEKFKDLDLKSFQVVTMSLVRDAVNWRAPEANKTRSREARESSTAPWAVLSRWRSPN